MSSRRDPDALLRRHARSMRREPTPAERALWPLLRNRNLGGFKFRRQVPIDGFIADFYCEAASIVVELDGGSHDLPDAADYDARRTQKFADLRIRVKRFSNHEVLRDPQSVARTILRVLNTGA